MIRKKEISCIFPPILTNKDNCKQNSHAYIGVKPQDQIGNLCVNETG